MQSAKITLELFDEEKKCTNVLTYDTKEGKSWLSPQYQLSEDIRLLILIINVLENWSNQERVRYFDKLRMDREEQALAKKE